MYSIYNIYSIIYLIIYLNISQLDYAKHINKTAQIETFLKKKKNNIGGSCKEQKCMSNC